MPKVKDLMFLRETLTIAQEIMDSGHGSPAMKGCIVVLLHNIHLLEHDLADEAERQDRKES